ncbi:MAG: PilZ domain-containing protein [Proteobacteria bacterium]|nr:PilZ domain-containing protein [Pseudomonadota bacterium]MBU1710203.1 PilZ domain-containing protein [Pseudomonadota bacterium]
MNEYREKRLNRRHEVKEPITYVYGEESYSSQTIDIGKGGIKFNTKQLLPPLSKVSITLKRDPSLIFNGLIIWSGRLDARYLAAIKFIDLTQEHTYYLEQFLLYGERSE